LQHPRYVIGCCHCIWFTPCALTSLSTLTSAYLSQYHTAPHCTPTSAHNVRTSVQGSNSRPQLHALTTLSPPLTLPCLGTSYSLASEKKRRCVSHIRVIPSHFSCGTARSSGTSVTPTPHAGGSDRGPFCRRQHHRQFASVEHAAVRPAGRALGAAGRRQGIRPYRGAA
jgi:hypothetical protein